MSRLRVNRLVESIRATQRTQDHLNRELELLLEPDLIGLDEDSIKRLIESLPECPARFNLWRKYLKPSY